MLDSMTGQYCDGETDDAKKDQDVEGYSNKTCKKALSVFYATCKEKGLDYTEPMPKEKVREHVSAILPFTILEKIVDKPLKIRGLAITAGMSRNFNIYTPEELQAFSSKLVAAPVYIEHVAVPNAVGKVTKTEWDGENLWYEAEIYDDEVAAQIRKGLIQHVSVGADYETLDIVDGQVPHGLHNAELSLVAVPGIPETNVQVLEKLKARKRVKEQDECCVFCGEPAEIWVACCFDCFKKLPLSESKKKELLEHQRKMREQQVEPIIAGEYVLGFYQDVALFLPEHFRTVWLDKENGILAVFGKLRAEPETERVQSIFFAKEKMWDQTKIQDWLSIHPDYMAPAGDSAVSKAPLIERGNMKKKVKEQDGEGNNNGNGEGNLTVDQIKAKIADLSKKNADIMTQLYPEAELTDEQRATLNAESETIWAEIAAFEKALAAAIIAQVGVTLGEGYQVVLEVKLKEAAAKKKLCAAVKTWNEAHSDDQITSDVCGVEPSGQGSSNQEQLLEAKVTELLARVGKLEKAHGGAQGNLSESLLKNSKEPTIKVTEAIKTLEGLLLSPMLERSSMMEQRHHQDIRKAIFKYKEMLKNG